MQYATIVDPGATMTLSLPGQSSRIIAPGRTMGGGMYSEGDQVPIFFENGDAQAPLVQTNLAGTRTMRTATVASPWIPGSDPPEQDPTWKVGM